MKSNLYIPQKIHVGFQKRDDTFTGKLAYVIYEDENGMLRKKALGMVGEIPKLKKLC